MKKRNIFLALVLVQVLSISEAQSLLDTTFWKKTECESGKFMLRYPYRYVPQNACGEFYKEVNNEKKFPLLPMFELFYPSHDYKMKKDPSTYLEWIEYRTRLLFSGDGPEGSLYGDSIVKNINWINKYGITGNIFYIQVIRRTVDNGKKIESYHTEGPVYVFKRSQDLNTSEPAFFFKVREDQCDSIDFEIIKLMFDNFEWVSK
jgi:hypothetical protein